MKGSRAQRHHWNLKVSQASDLKETLSKTDEDCGMLCPRSFPSDSVVGKLSAKQQTQVWFLGWEDPLEKEMTNHSSILAMDRGVWQVQSMGSQRIRHEWAHEHTHFPTQTNFYFSWNSQIDFSFSGSWFYQLGFSSAVFFLPFSSVWFALLKCIFFLSFLLAVETGFPKTVETRFPFIFTVNFGIMSWHKSIVIPVRVHLCTLGDTGLSGCGGRSKIKGLPSWSSG